MVFDEFNEIRDALYELDPIEIEGIEYVPQFMYGSHQDMLKYLISQRKSGSPIYPLVWLETPFTVNFRESWATADCNFIVATLTTSNLSNIERTDKTFKNVLSPVRHTVEKRLKSRFFVAETFEVTKHFNYDTNDEVQASDIWDAIAIKVEIKFNTNCF